MEQTTITFKKVDHDDFDKVMSIRHKDDLHFVYRGTDYLPDYFHMLLDKSCNDGYAAIVNDVFRSFTMFTYVDNGATIIRRAMRTHKLYENKGLATKTFQYVLENSSKSKQLCNHITIHGGVDKLNEHTILKMEYRDFKGFRTTLLERLASHESGLHISSDEIETAQLGELLDNSNLCKILFPTGRIIVDLVPYRIMRSNSILMKTDRSTILASDLHNPDDATLTFGNYYHSHAGLVYNLDVYGKISSSFREHVIQHLKTVLTYSKSHDIVIFVYTMNEDWNYISSVMKDVGFEETPLFGADCIICNERMVRD